MIPLTVNGVTYNYPELDDEGWGPDATNWALSITQGVLTKAGGLFSLTADANFGPNFGLKSLYYQSRTGNPPSTGVVRLGTTESIVWRNNANNGDIPLATASSDRLQFNSIDLVDVSSSQTLTNKTLTNPVIDTISFTGVAYLSNGSASTPSLAFTNLTGTGLYKNGSGLGFTTGNTAAGGIDSSQNWTFLGQTLAINGSTSAPGYSFTSEASLGFSRDSGGSVLLSSSNATQARFIIDAITANANSILVLNTPTGTGDSYITLGENSTPDWAFGRDDSDSGAFVISAGTALGTSNAFKIATSGAVTISSTLLSGNITSSAFISQTANPAGAGAIRLANSDAIKFRNSGNSGDVALATGSSNSLIAYASIDLVNISSAQTLTNKTLTSPVIGTIVNTGTLTLPTATDTLVGRATTDTLTNKTLSGNTAVTLISGSGTLTLNTSGTVTLPNATDTLVGKATTDTLTNKTLTGNTAVNLVSGSGTLTLNTTGTVTLPSATDTLVGKATTDTLTNKTISGSSNTLSNIGDAALTTSYLKADGSRPLTADWATGNFRVTIGNASVSTSGYLYVGNQAAAAGILTATNQQGIAVDYTVSSNATVGAQGVDSFVRTANTSFTCPVVSNFKADTISKGAASTITRSIQYEASGDLTVGTNNAIFADNETFTGNWAINLASANASLFTGGVQFATTSGTKTTLNYYEEGTFTANFNQGAGASGTNTSYTVNFVRIGKMVTLVFPAVQPTAGATNAVFSTASSTVPATLRPTTSGLFWMNIGKVNGADSATPLQTGISTSGVLSIQRDGTGATTFTSGSVSGPYGFTMTYTIQ